MRGRNVRATGIVALLALSAFFTWLHWSRLPSCWGDNSRWLYEAQRWANGEVPYLDFLWQYPPLGLWVAGVGIKLGGPAVMGVQAIFAVLSAAVALLAFAIARKFIADRIAVGLATTLLVVEAIIISPYTLFSMRLYSPAVPVGVVGLLWLLLHAIEIGRTAAFRARTLLLYAGASTVCLLSKPEFMIVWAAVTGTLGLLAASPRRRGAPADHSRVAVRCALLVSTGVPALVVYILLAHRVGLSNLADGILGYGVPKLVCPWWPTGIGILGAVAALLQAQAIRVAVRIAFRTDGRPTNRSRAWLGSAVVSTMAYVPVLFAATDKTLNIRSVVGYLVNFSTWALIAQWGSIAALVRAVRDRLSGRGGDEGLLLLTLAVCTVAIRGFFGSPFEFYPSVHFSAHVIAILAWSIIIVLDVERRTSGKPLFDRRRGLFAFGLAACGVRIVTYLIVAPRYHALPEEFGGLQVAENAEECAEIFRWLKDRPHEMAADISYGGIIHIVTGRRSATLTTQYQALNPPRHYRDLDVERFRTAAPELVIAGRGVHLNTWLGIPLKTRCEFPRIVWRTNALACESTSEVYPIVAEVESAYEPVLETSSYQILRKIGSNAR